MVSLVKTLTNVRPILVVQMPNVPIYLDHSNVHAMKVTWEMVFIVRILMNVGQIHAIPMLLVPIQRDLSVVLVTVVTMETDSFVLMLMNVYHQNHVHLMLTVKIDQVHTLALVFKDLVEMERLAKT